MRHLLYCAEDPKQDSSILQSPKKQKIVSWESQFESEEVVFKAAIKAHAQILGLGATAEQKNQLIAQSDCNECFIVKHDF